MLHMFTVTTANMQAQYFGYASHSFNNWSSVPAIHSITNVTHLFLNCGFMVYQYTSFWFCARFCTFVSKSINGGFFMVFFFRWKSAQDKSIPLFCIHLLSLSLSTCIFLDWFLSWAPKGVTYRAFAGGCYKWKFTLSSVSFVNRAWWFVFPNWETKKTKDKCLYFAFIQFCM